MKHFGIALISCICWLATGSLHAQIEHSAFTTTGRGAATTFVTDYHSVGINPANLGWSPLYENRNIALGFVEGSYSLHSQALQRRDLRREFIGSDRRFDWNDKQDAARSFADAGLALNADIMLFGAAWHNEQAGGFAFQIRDRAQWSSRFNPFASELMFQGFGSNYFDLLVLATGDTIPNAAGLSDDSLALVILGMAGDPQLLSRLFNGTHVNFTWYREFNFSYGRRIVHNDGFELHAGVGIKHLVGIGIIDIRADGSSFDAYSSLSHDFDIDYGDNTVRNAAHNTAFPRAAGRGWGFDVGFSAIIADRYKLGLSVTNVGAINWRGNAYSVSDGLLQTIATNGLDNYNFFGGIDEFVGSSGLLEWRPDASRSIALPSSFRSGAGMVVNDRVEVGLDVVVPLNDVPGSFESPIVAVGGHVLPMRWLQLSAGLSFGGKYGTKVPLGVTFIAGRGTWEAGVASRDALTFFVQQDPTISLAMGFLRFRF
jgi:hypothetical protein